MARVTLVFPFHAEEALEVLGSWVTRLHHRLEHVTSWPDLVKPCGAFGSIHRWCAAACSACIRAANSGVIVPGLGGAVGVPPSMARVILALGWGGFSNSNSSASRRRVWGK